MSAINQKNDLVIAHRMGVPVYSENPSIPKKDGLSRPRKKQLGNEQRGLVINSNTGEVLGAGTAIMYEWEEVDSERFVKLFIGALTKATGMSKTGLAIFNVVYNQMRATPNSDRVLLSFYRASQEIKELNERTYRRGVRELLDRDILYRSAEDGVFFVDITCMFNGDRLAFVKAYHLKGSIRQQELPLEDARQQALSLDNNS